MVQLTSAARAAHSAGLLLRPQSLMPCKVIITSPRRIRVGKQLQVKTCSRPGGIFLKAPQALAYCHVAAVTHRAVACLYTMIYQGSV